MRISNICSKQVWHNTYFRYQDTKNYQHYEKCKYTKFFLWVYSNWINRRTIKHISCYYLKPLLEKLVKKQKSLFLFGDFNVDLLKATNKFLDSLSSDMFLSHIQPIRITSHSKSIIANIFSNYISQEIISDHLTSTISDHLPQFLIVVIYLSKVFFDSMSKILDKHVPLKKFSKYKLKFKTMPWITTGLQKYICIKIKLFRDFINKKDLTQKTELHNII